MTDQLDRAADHLAFLERQVAKLEALAELAATGEEPQVGSAVSARSKAAELRKRIEQLKDWQARRPLAPRSRGKAKRDQALLLIAAGRSTGEVAHELAVDRRTIQRWRSDPEFDEELRELQSAQTDALHALLMANQLDVARCLVAIATGPDTSDMARVHAARVFFELGGRHKNSPVAPTKREGEIESAEDVKAALADIPDTLLQEVLAERAAARATRAGRRKREKNL